MSCITGIVVPLLLGLPVEAFAAERGDVGSYLKPNSFNLSVGEKVKLSVYEGGLADGRAAIWPGQTAEWLFVRVAGTQRNMDGKALKPADNGDTFFELPLEHAGVTMIGLDHKSTPSELTPAEVDRLLARTPDLGSGTRPAANTTARVRHVDSSKILLLVAADDDKRGHSAVPQSKSGQIAEIRLMADPMQTPVGAALPLRVYLNGSSRAGAIVMATSAKSGQTRRLTANESGMATLNISATGIWLIETWHVERLSNDSEADWTTYRSSIAFEIPEGAQQ